MTEKRANLAKGGLTRAQERVLVALLTCATHRQVAAAAGVSERSLRRYLAPPQFQSAYLAERRAMMQQAVALAQRFTLDCVQVMLDIAKDSAMPPNTRLTSANSVFSIADDGLKMEDLMARVEALEQKIEQQISVSGNEAFKNGAATRNGSYR